MVRIRLGIPAAVALVALSLSARAQAAVTPDMQRAVRAATFEVVLTKPAHDPLSYEKPLPLELIPYQQRTDKYRQVGTAFAVGPDTYVTAAHVLEAAVDSQYGDPALRGADGKVYPIATIVKFSADEDYAVFTLAGAPAPAQLAVDRTPQLDEPVFTVGNALGEGIPQRSLHLPDARSAGRPVAMDPILRSRLARQQRRSAPRCARKSHRHRDRQIAR